MSKFAVIKTGGKQYLVKEGEKLRVEKLPLDNSGLIAFSEVLAVGDDNGIEVGKPFLSNSKVEAERVGDGRFKKVIVARYHSKTRYRKNKGHRQHFTEVRISSIA
ncbi:50S ribosomal protein L21 [Candidatus Giovannonibacteria bacterium RIFCSPLOWO2_02_FULL_45_14]|uniref:Large ribosomal subunit protein bL21 n=1 Tax=Candidatus Giovannonibacteria bacterium RIFCSPLOWO2_12_FULL_44_15 TaxID=1798364 RepID=A0A1F5Y0I5_9BACT|nr:MAG: 50S ribosomal protein L21 [Candidatus Giovannonibacteria bacterium RIFCSPHIGHO2_02_FULL_44_31]OGF75999.1 MAG: 50S ribosomal protein L21 [Candidatus Giovannonibacteria bacterium RIFCSPHIGHO2_12_FULL_44_29]OGF90758.1 MAG: 50S ribosomal protein L21 [Candidatus Giovannonibacteria bacterium RIFCSPLOWO2_02_FULL_45_14]OGF93659.1 MAG: 50S ribosomal protein L21 [Candidatus Giovannonibacteria bacterium RIFCSPLOWO2_12_FULL_44_15]